VSTGPISEPGTFGSVSKTITFYPLKSSQPLQWFNTLFFLVFALFMIFPGVTVMLVSKVINIDPGIANALATSFTVPQIRLPFLIFAVVMELICIYLIIIRANFSFVLTEDGISCSTSMYRIYSPWENIIGIESRKYSILSLTVLTLKRELHYGRTMEEGRKQGIPVLEYTKLARVTRYPQRLARSKNSFLAWKDTFPLLGISNRKRVKKKLMTAIHLYAPHISILIEPVGK
jgi:hypothetical protein